MTMLCNRCELLFQECRPLLGQKTCWLARTLTAATPIVPIAEPEPVADAQSKVSPIRAASAWVFDHRTFEAGIVPILTANIKDAP